MEPSSGQVAGLGEYADQLASEQFIACSVRLVINLCFSPLQTQLDSTTNSWSSEAIQFPLQPRSVTQSREVSAVHTMADSLPAEPGSISDAHNMARTYSAEELLTMRDTLPFLICDMSKLNPAVTSGIISSFFTAFTSSRDLQTSSKSQRISIPN